MCIRDSAGCEPLSFLMERRQIDGPAAGVLARCPGAAVYTADRSVLKALTGYALTRGVLCAMRLSLIHIWGKALYVNKTRRPWGLQPTGGGVLYNPCSL